VRRKKRRSKKRKVTSPVDHALRFVTHGLSIKPEPWVRTNVESPPDLTWSPSRPLSQEERDLQALLVKRRRR